MTGFGATGENGRPKRGPAGEGKRGQELREGSESQGERHDAEISYPPHRFRGEGTQKARIRDAPIPRASWLMRGGNGRCGRTVLADSMDAAREGRGPIVRVLIRLSGFRQSLSPGKFIVLAEANERARTIIPGETSHAGC